MVSFRVQGVRLVLRNCTDLHRISQGKIDIHWQRLPLGSDVQLEECKKVVHSLAKLPTIEVEAASVQKSAYESYPKIVVLRVYAWRIISRHRATVS